MITVKELKLFDRSQESIWTDPHIAKLMLAAHLDQSSDAASRKQATIRRTIDWIAERVPGRAKVLDLGCGPGLYARALAGLGHEVTGLDMNRESVGYARRANRKDKLPIRYRHANYLISSLGGPYGCALMIYCDFGALIPAEQALLLGKVRACLKDNGTFIFDVFGHGLLRSKTETREWSYAAAGGFWSKKPYWLLTEWKLFPEADTVGARYLPVEDGKKPREFIMWDQCYTADSIAKLLAANGFEVLEIKNDLVGKTDFASDDVLFIVARRQ